MRLSTTSSRDVGALLRDVAIWFHYTSVTPPHWITPTFVHITPTHIWPGYFYFHLAKELHHRNINFTFFVFITFIKRNICLYHFPFQLLYFHLFIFLYHFHICCLYYFNLSNQYYFQLSTLLSLWSVHIYYNLDLKCSSFLVLLGNVTIWFPPNKTFVQITLPWAMCTLFLLLYYISLRF